MRCTNLGRYNKKTESHHFTGHRGSMPAGGKCKTCRICAGLIGYKENEEEELDA